MEFLIHDFEGHSIYKCRGLPFYVYASTCYNHCCKILCLVLFLEEKINHHSGEIGDLIQNCSKLFCINLFGSGVQQAVLICCYIFVIVRYLKRARNVINHHLESRTTNLTTSQDPRKYNACSLK